MGLEKEAVGGERHLEQVRELGVALVGHRRCGQHQQVQRQLDLLVQVRVAVGDLHAAVGAHLRRGLVLVAREDDAQLTRFGVVLLEQAEGAHLLEPDVHGAIRLLLLEPDRVLDALRAAGARAVRLVLVQRAGAEDEADGLGARERLVALGQHLLELHAADDFGAGAQAVQFRQLLAGAGGDDDDAVLDGRPLPVGGLDHAGEVADEALEVGQPALQMDAHVWVVDQALLELRHERRRVVALDGLVEFEHMAAQLGGALHQVHLVAHVAQGEGGGHAGDAAAHDQGGMGERHVHLVERL